MASSVNRSQSPIAAGSLPASAIASSEGASFAHLVPALPAAADEEIHQHDFSNKFAEVHRLFVSHLSRLSDVLAYMEGLKLHPDIRHDLGEAYASDELLVNSFEEYCLAHPESSLAKCHKPHIDERIKQNLPNFDGIAPHLVKYQTSIVQFNALSQHLSELDLPIPKLKLNEVRQYFRDFEKLNTLIRMLKGEFPGPMNWTIVEEMLFSSRFDWIPGKYLAEAFIKACGFRPKLARSIVCLPEFVKLSGADLGKSFTQACRDQPGLARIIMTFPGFTEISDRDLMTGFGKIQSDAVDLVETIITLPRVIEMTSEEGWNAAFTTSVEEGQEDRIQKIIDSFGFAKVSKIILGHNLIMSAIRADMAAVGMIMHSSRFSDISTEDVRSALNHAKERFDKTCWPEESWRYRKIIEMLETALSLRARKRSGSEIEEEGPGAKRRD